MVAFLFPCKSNKKTLVCRCMKNLYQNGEAVKTTVVAISGDTVFLDLGLKSEGFLDKAEVTNEDGTLSVKEGDAITVYFVGSSHDELHFTTKLAGPKANKDILLNAFKNGIPVEGHVTQEIKGGYEVMVGTTRAFCPYSQMGFHQKKESSEYVGQHLTFRISEYKNDGRNIVLSNRIIMEEEHDAGIEKLAKKLTVGTNVTATVISLESYGAFVNVDGFQALIPLSEISHARVKAASDVLQVGQEVTAQVIKADWAHEKVSLSIKALEKDPWQEAAEQFTPGTKTEGSVARVAEFGLFVTIAPGIDGLVHVSKLDVERNTNLRKVYQIGQKMPVIVDSVDTEQKRISLSPVVSSEENDIAAEYFSAQKDDDGETYNPFAALLKK